MIALRESHWESDEVPPKVEFPPTLTNTERKFVHQLAAQLGLHSKSSGKGEDRRIAIYPSKNKSKTTADEDDGLSGIPILQVGSKGIKALQQHVQNFPPSPAEKLEARETGSSLVEAIKGENGDDDAAVTQALSQMGLVASQKRDSKRYNHKVKPVDLEYRKRNHEEAQQLKQKNQKAYQSMISMRSELPAYKHQDEVVQKVLNNQVTIISGDTGCGKSTQVPQFVLDANPTCNIVVTQPRRIAAISIAERVAHEQMQGDTGGQVGYKVRLENSQSEKTQVLFMTPGVLLRQLQSDPYLQSYTHIMMDEIHERDQYQEFLLVVLRDLLPQRPDLRLILMSATLQTERLIEYFVEKSNTDVVNALQPPALVEMKGRMFEVQEFFLEHVLEMTGYIAVDIGEADVNGEVRVVAPTITDDQLEAELARFTQTEITPQASKVHPKLKCVLCRRRDFKDAVDLGTHLALCDGGGDEDEVPNEANETTQVAPSFGGAGNDKLVNGGEEGFLEGIEFEDYDVDAEVEIEDYEYEFQGRNEDDASSNHDADVGLESNADTEEQWDGKSPFGRPSKNEAAADTDAEELFLTKKEEAMLKQYQSMHDDETVDEYLLLETIRYINASSCCDGAILVFLPGWQEITEMIILLESTPPFSNRSKFWILPLHSGIPSKDQRKVLQTPPTGIRKIVLSTNIAETSLTINDVSFVIDTGRAKEKSYDPHLKTSTLQSTWISAASAKQRKGRAGRTKRGVCFYLFSQRRHMSLRPFVESELLRTPLEEMCLLCKQLGLAPGGFQDEDGVPAFLGKAMSAPHARSILNALELLVDLGGMQPETNNLTDLGECLAQLSLEPRVGKMTIWSYLLGCARVAANMAVAMSYKSPFVLPAPHQRKTADEAKVKMSRGSESDQVTVHYALETRPQGNGRQSSINEFCRENFLSINTLQMVAEIRKNLTRELSTLGFPSPTLIGSPNARNNGGKNNRGGTNQTTNSVSYHHNRHDSDHGLWQAAIAAGLYPNVAFRKRGEVNFSTMTNKKVKVHVSSVNAVRGQPLNTKCDIPKGQLQFVCFGEMVKGGNAQFFTVNQTTHLASPLPLLLLCGTSLTVRPIKEVDEEAESTAKKRNKNTNKDALLTLDNWIVFKCSADVAANLVVLRKRLDTGFWNAIATPKVSKRSKESKKDLLINLGPQEKDAVEILGTILQSAHLQSESVKSVSSSPRRR